MLRSQLFKGDRLLEACLVDDASHITPGAIGDHVSKIQTALKILDGLKIADLECRAKHYGPSTAAAVVSFKSKRNIINRAYQTRPDNIVGKLTIASLDQGLVDRPCAGWESDPQSFSKRAAENFVRTEFNNTTSHVDTIRCSGTTCTVHFEPAISFDITVDMSGVPGTVVVSGTGAPLILRPKLCSYRYSCDASGAISFTKITCRFI